MTASDLVELAGREAIARIIEPYAYSELDAVTNKPAPGEPWLDTHSARGYAAWWETQKALVKADAILALRERIPLPGVEGREEGSSVAESAAIPQEARPAVVGAPLDWKRAGDEQPVKDEMGEQWLLTWNPRVAAYDIGCIDGQWRFGEQLDLHEDDLWAWLPMNPELQLRDEQVARESSREHLNSTPPLPADGGAREALDEGVLAEALERSLKDAGLSKLIHVSMVDILGRHMVHHIKDVTAEFAALPSSWGGEKGDSSSRDHDHTAGIALEGSWPVAEYVEELANVLWQMARGDFSRSWSTNFRNEIRSAPNIITIAGNQLAKLAAVARSSAKQVVGESSRDEHSILPLSSSRGEAEQK